MQKTVNFIGLDCTLVVFKFFGKKTQQLASLPVPEATINMSEPENVPLATPVAKKWQFRFKPKFDVNLLRQAQIERPFTKKKEQLFPKLGITFQSN